MSGYKYRCSACTDWIDYGFGISDGVDYYCNLECLFAYNDCWIDKYIDCVITKEKGSFSYE